MWATTAALHAPAYAYPYEKLDRLWKTVLLHQFHDILPGSSIAWVHREAEAEYARVAEELEALTAEAVAALGAGGPRVLSTSPYDRSDVVRTADGAPAYVEVPASGSAPLTDAQPPQPVKAAGRILDNGLVRVEVAADGTLSSVRDLRAAAKSSPAGATCSACTPTSRTTGTPGTSTSTTGTATRTCWRRSRWPSSRRTRCSARSA